MLVRDSACSEIFFLGGVIIIIVYKRIFNAHFRLASGSHVYDDVMSLLQTLVEIEVSNREANF